MPLTLEERTARLSPPALRESAERLLEGADPVDVVMQLLRQVRQHDDQEEAIRLGYSHSAKWERDLHEQLLDQEHVLIAQAIEREARNPQPRGRQQVTYAGGLRRAARIARGWR